MTTTTDIEVGRTYTVRYPFVRYVANLLGNEGEPLQTEGWRPGCEADTDEYSTTYAADGHGEMLLTVVSTHKPGRFQSRVFYTRQWKDPDGRVFGRGALRVATLGVFRRLLRGYRHPYHCETEIDHA